MSELVCKPLKDWIKEEDGTCKECSLAILVAWYKDELGYDKVKHLEKIDSPEKVIEELDMLKEQHPEKADRLKELDCFIQQANKFLKEV